MKSNKPIDWYKFQTNKVIYIVIYAYQYQLFMKGKKIAYQAK